MSNPTTSIQSLKAVDAWIDVINANINGGVRTAFKASRLRFAGSNAQLDRPATASTLPLQYPEPSLMTANTVIDWSQGAVTSSTEITHVALQGKGLFKLKRMVDDPLDPETRFYYTRDGEFRWMALPAGMEYGVPGAGNGNGSTTGDRIFLVNSNGLVVMGDDDEPITYRAGFLDGGNPPLVAAYTAYRDSKFIEYLDVVAFDNPQSLEYSQFGSTVFRAPPQAGAETRVSTSETTRLGKALEASNSSMTQSVPELSLAQKLFSALTKVIQTHQTNVDSVLNTVR